MSDKQLRLIGYWIEKSVSDSGDSGVES